MNLLTLARRLRPISRRQESKPSDEFQQAVLRALKDLADNQAELLETYKSISPERLRWKAAVIALLVSVAAIVLATASIVGISRINDEAASFHELAEAQRAQAITGLVGALPPFEEGITLESSRKKPNVSAEIKLMNTVVSITGDSEHELDEAAKLDSQGDAISGSTDLQLYISDIGLVFGSTVAGGIVGWLITRTLEVRHRRREVIAKAVHSTPA